MDFTRRLEAVSGKSRFKIDFAEETLQSEQDPKTRLQNCRLLLQLVSAEQGIGYRISRTRTAYGLVK
jgi:hypothetical protein